VDRGESRTALDYLKEARKPAANVRTVWMTDEKILHSVIEREEVWELANLKPIGHVCHEVTLRTCRPQ
jgi:hypothetical protein